MVLIDDYQGTGQIPINVNAMDIDFLVTGTLKWLMGGPGLAFVYIREGLMPTIRTNCHWLVWTSGAVPIQNARV